MVQSCFSPVTKVEGRCQKSGESTRQVIKSDQELSASSACDMAHPVLGPRTIVTSFCGPKFISENRPTKKMPEPNQLFHGKFCEDLSCVFPLFSFVTFHPFATLCERRKSQLSSLPRIKGRAFSGYKLSTCFLKAVVPGS